MDSALANALKRKEELERELERVNQFIQLYGEFSKESKADDGVGMRQTHTSNANLHGRAETLRHKMKVRGRPDDFADIMEAILRERKRPMPRGILVSEIERRGHVIPSRDKARYLGTILWRQSDRFESVDGGYWLKGVPVPKSADLIG